MSQLVLIIY